MNFTEVTGLSPLIDVLDLGSKSYFTDEQNYNRLNSIRTTGIDFYTKSELEENSNFDHVISAIIGDGEVRDFYICEMESCSSLYKPNTVVLERYQNLAEWMTIKDTINIQTTKLDDLELPYKPDYIKSDIQGADSLAIKHGSSCFDNALVVEIEVEFLEQYKDQPLFSDIEILLREKGFIFHSFTGYGSRLLAPASHPDDPYCTLNQWMWSHAIFIKDFLSVDLTYDNYIKLAAIAHDVYQSYDISLHCLERCGHESAKRYGHFLKEYLVEEIV